MEVTRTAVVHSPFKGRFTDRRIAELCAEKMNVKLCSLRYTNIGIVCTFGFGVYIGDELYGLDSDKFHWI